MMRRLALAVLKRVDALQALAGLCLLVLGISLWSAAAALTVAGALLLAETFLPAFLSSRRRQ